MKANVHLEFGDRELEDFASRVAAKWAVKVMGSVMADIDDAMPDLVQAFKNISFGIKHEPAPENRPGYVVTPAPQPSPPPPPPGAPDDVIAAWYRAHAYHHPRPDEPSVTTQPPAADSV